MDNIPISKESKEFVEIQKHIEEKSGIVLNSYNAHLLESRLSIILKDLKIKNVEELYYKLCVLNDSLIQQSVIESMTTNETFWFRDLALWNLVDEEFLPEFILKLRSNKVNKIRIWSAACSYGQEPYSIAMSISRYLKKHQIEDIHLNQFDILATDISKTVLEYAKKGIYDTIAISRGLSESDKNMFFSQKGDTWKIDDDILNAVQFKQFNLLDFHYSFEPFDLILFRNVLIYFSENVKKNIYNKIALSLKIDGFLCVGSSELIEDNDRVFKRQQVGDGVYFTKNMSKEGGIFA